ncbi:hypothetical protein BOTBODRAFT_281047 [Botryobasidium botryosum FD-172 SS1]|uniref:Programmed cell death protein 10 dimerisation domain-containing protein n=1 Tax=Botryobasidium botryosum (strain FD-172 SS1) TaxID=930990 RepID=A0A067MVG0_BOTB1|nr:hypothetical protein BOTBODRAFT_281047 [Botryobasidium botryosum FD-172 SS1]
MWDFGTVRHVGRQGTIGRHTPVDISRDNGRYAAPSVTSPDRPLSASFQGYVPPSPSSVQTSNGFVPGHKAGNSSISSTATVNGQTPGHVSATPITKPLPPSPMVIHDESGTVRAGRKTYDSDEDEEDDIVEDELTQRLDEVALDEYEERTMLDSVVLPALASLFPRVSTREGHAALAELQRAFTNAERIIPGVTSELINEIVDSVEHVEE